MNTLLERYVRSRKILLKGLLQSDFLLQNYSKSTEATARPSARGSQAEQIALQDVCHKSKPHSERTQAVLQRGSLARCWRTHATVMILSAE